MSAQGEGHCLDVHLVRLGVPPASRDQEALRIEYEYIKTAITEKTGEPESVVTRLEANLELDRLPELPLQPQFDLVEMFHQPFGIAAGNGTDKAKVSAA